MPRTQLERLSVIEEQMEENKREHVEIKACIKEVKDVLTNVEKSVVDLTTNHIVFKTKVMVYWAVGVAIGSAIVQTIIQVLLRKI